MELLASRKCHPSFKKSYLPKAGIFDPGYTWECIGGALKNYQGMWVWVCVCVCVCTCVAGEGILDQWNRIPGVRVWHRLFAQLIPQSSPGQDPLSLDNQLALQLAFKITPLSSCYIVCLSEDPAPGSNRLVPGLVSGVGHGSGDTRLPGVITGVWKTDAIWSRGRRGWDWPGHTLSLQHLPAFGDISRATLSLAPGISASGGVLLCPCHTHTHTH